MRPELLIILGQRRQSRCLDDVVGLVFKAIAQRLHLWPSFSQLRVLERAAFPGA